MMFGLFGKTIRKVSQFQLGASRRARCAQLCKGGKLFLTVRFFW